VIVPAGRGGARTAPIAGSSVGSRNCAGPEHSDRPASPGSSTCTPRRCIGSCAAKPSTGSRGWTARPVGSSAASRPHAPGSWCTSTPRSSAASPSAAVGALTAGRLAARTVQHVGYDYVHRAIDAYSRVAYSEILPAEDRDCCTGFLQRAITWFAAIGVQVERVLTDNGVGYRSHAWRDVCLAIGITHTRTRPYTPRTNGKVERFNRTLLDEWAYVRSYRSDNHHRCHTALDGQPPMSRLNNEPGHNS